MLFCYIFSFLECVCCIVICVQYTCHPLKFNGHYRYTMKWIDFALLFSDHKFSRSLVLGFIYIYRVCVGTGTLLYSYMMTRKKKIGFVLFDSIEWKCYVWIVVFYFIPFWLTIWFFFLFLNYLLVELISMRYIRTTLLYGLIFIVYYSKSKLNYSMYIRLA